MEMEDKLNLILSKLEGLEKGQSSIQHEVAEMKQEVSEIKQAVFRLEESQPQDIRAMLERINRKIDSFKVDLDYIAEKQAIQDMKINRIEKQIQS